jgi:hypothetical protein
LSVEVQELQESSGNPVGMETIVSEIHHFDNGGAATPSPPRGISKGKAGDPLLFYPFSSFSILQR